MSLSALTAEVWWSVFLDFWKKLGDDYALDWTVSAATGQGMRNGLTPLVDSFTRTIARTTLLALYPDIKWPWRALRTPTPDETL